MWLVPLHDAEDGLAETRCGLEVAKLEWALAQIQLRDLDLKVAA
jgi:hypothetical protein